MWLGEAGVPRCVALPSSNLVPFGRWPHPRGREYSHGEPDSALSSGYAPDSARTETMRSSTSQGSAELLCASVKVENREVSEGNANL